MRCRFPCSTCQRAPRPEAEKSRPLRAMPARSEGSGAPSAPDSSRRIVSGRESALEGRRDNPVDITASPRVFEMGDRLVDSVLCPVYTLLPMERDHLHADEHELFSRYFGHVVPCRDEVAGEGLAVSIEAKDGGRAVQIEYYPQTQIARLRTP